MPPRRTNQCTLIDRETGRRCRRNGTGDPTLCGECRRTLDASSDTGAFAEIFASMWAGKRPSQGAVENAAKTVLEGLFGKRMSEEEVRQIWERARAASRTHSGSSSSSSSEGASGRSSQEDEATKRAREISWARRTLGFKATEPLTKDVVKVRYRELARKYHPDHHPDKAGGAAKMVDLNRAMEILSGPG